MGVLLLFILGSVLPPFLACACSEKTVEQAGVGIHRKVGGVGVLMIRRWLLQQAD